MVQDAVTGGAFPLPEQPSLSPQELALSALGYIPEGTPESWEEIDATLQYFYPGYNKTHTLTLEDSIDGGNTWNAVGDTNKP